MTLSFTLPHWFDFHTHLRQGALMGPIIQSQIDMGCYGMLAMPNTRPIVGNVTDTNDNDYWSIQTYRDMIMDAGGNQLDHVITPIYLHNDLTPKDIEDGAKSGILQTAKCYPPHGTTNSSFGCPIEKLMDNGVIQAMSDNGITLNIHGEEHGLSAESYFDSDTNAEDIFYRERMPRLIEKFPDLKIVCEHITTKTATDFVLQSGPNVGATITPQHLLYTIGDLIIGLKYHLFCLPILKFEKDRAALLKAVTTPSQTKFFAGTDSAAHTVKATDCGCAAGCFTGSIAPQLYAQAFEKVGMDFTRVDHVNMLKAFLCENGPDFYGIEQSNKTFTLSKTPQSISKIPSDEGDITPLPLGLGHDTIPWTLTL
jgi:dihydroorotase